MNAVLDEMAQAIVTEKAFAETVPLSEEQSAFEISLISLSSSLNDGHNRRFADFLISTQGKKIMQKHGFVPK